MGVTRNVTDKNERRRAFSIKALAESYEISEGLVRLEIARGHLKAARIGRRVVIPIEAVKEWLDRDGAEAVAKPQTAEVSR